MSDKMGFEDFDPSVPVSYFSLISLMYQNFRSLKSYDEMVELIGLSCLSDITHTPVMQLLRQRDALPPGYTALSSMTSNSRIREKHG